MPTLAESIMIQDKKGEYTGAKLMGIAVGNGCTGELDRDMDRERGVGRHTAIESFFGFNRRALCEEKRGWMNVCEYLYSL